MTQSTETVVDGSPESATTNADTTPTGGSPEPIPEQHVKPTSKRAAGSANLSESRELPLDETFELLRNQRRRYILRYLETASGQVSLSDLAEQIAAWENDKAVSQITSSERKRVYVGLYQCHLPKMDGMGVISFNKPRGLIERGENAADVEPYVNRITDPDPAELRGPRLGLPVFALSLAPVAILLLSQTMLPLAVAMSLVLVATAGGVLSVLRSDAQRDVTAEEARVG